MKAAVLVFPGINRERDMARTLKLTSGHEPAMVWHSERELPGGTDLIVIPGGFSYGDYLRCGAIARFSPVMDAIIAAAGDGLPVLGICNGFQVLCEAGLLPGALLANTSLRFVCRQVDIEVVGDSAWSDAGPPAPTLSIPVKHTTGRYFARDLDPAQVVFRYAAGQNPNGSQDDIAGVRNEAGNVVGLMPHPEHATDPLLGSSDGGALLRSFLAACVAARTRR